MRYPRRSPYLIYKRISKNEYQVENWMESEIYHIKADTVIFLKQLDGRHNPYSLLPDCEREYVRELVRELREFNLLAPKKRPMRLGVGSFICPIVYCYPGEVQKKVAGIWNRVLMLLFIPMMILGICIQKSSQIDVVMHNKGEFAAGILLGVAVGVVFHEISHAHAGLAFNGHPFEMGVGTRFFIPHFYVLLDDRNITNTAQKIQYLAAGVEANMFLYGAFMGLVPLKCINPSVIYVAGFLNCTLGIINLLPLSGLDGLKILSVVFRKKDLLMYAMSLIKNRKRHGKTLRNSGSMAALTGAYILVGFQILFLILLYMKYIL